MALRSGQVVTNSEYSAASGKRQQKLSGLKYAMNGVSKVVHKQRLAKEMYEV